MISNPNLILFACISKGATILAEFSSGQSEVQSLAHKCVEKAPPFHSIFSQTVSKRTYTFLIQDPHVYFAIFDESIDKLESLRFLNGLKCALDEILESGSVVGTDSHCLQSQFDPIFRRMMGMDLDSELETPSVSPSEARDAGTSSLGSSKGTAMAVSPMLSKSGKLFSLKKKKRSAGENNGDAKDSAAEHNKVEEIDDLNGGGRDFPVSAQKGVGFYAGQDRQKAKQVWRKHIWVVLALDLIICAALFGIWLWVCRGFQCIDG